MNENDAEAKHAGCAADTPSSKENMTVKSSAKLSRAISLLVTGLSGSSVVGLDIICCVPVKALVMVADVTWIGVVPLLSML